MITASSPAKLIISGEHSILYGQPALAMALKLYTRVSIESLSTPNIDFRFKTLNHYAKLSLAKLNSIAAKLSAKQQGFSLSNSFALLYCTVSELLARVNKSIQQGFAMSVDSDIPLGCGMGSSAACINASIKALLAFFAKSWPLDLSLNFARDMESMQHGKSSGLDLELSSNGGVRYYDGVNFHKRNSFDFPLYLVNTGKPIVATRDCVLQASRVLSHDKILQQEFGDTTRAIDRALQAADLASFADSMRYNQELLERLAIVPARVADFITEIHALGGSAKVCGAGASAGDAAGIVMVYGCSDLQELTKRFGYSWQLAEMDNDGSKLL